MGASSALVFLDMGEYEVPGINVAAARGGEAAQPAPAPGKGGAAAPTQQLRVHGHGVLRVYSVAPSCLAERAKEWGGSLAFREGWRQSDRGFFDAPGAVAAACLTPRDLALAPDAMPPATIVFAAVDGAKWLLRWRHGTEARETARLLHLVMSAALRAVPGGYMCSERDGGLRHILAFGSPDSALQWCLLVQEALMYAPWPEALLGMPGFGVQHAADGTLLFRGPRIKMGVSEGTPSGLVADGEGRADYFGACVKKAARYTDAVAHGGQVVCELQLAKEVFSNWRLTGPHSGGDELFPGPNMGGARTLAPLLQHAPPPPVQTLPAAAAAAGIQGAQQGQGQASPAAPGLPVLPQSPLAHAVAHGTQQQQQPQQQGTSKPQAPRGLPSPSAWPASPPLRNHWWPARMPGSAGASAVGLRQALPSEGDDDVMGVPGPSRTLSGTELIRHPRFSRAGASGAFLSPFTAAPPGACSISRAPAAAGTGAAAASAAASARQAQAPSEGALVRRLGRPRALPTAMLEDMADMLPCHSVAVLALFLGKFALKGADPLEIVCVTATALAARPLHGPQDDTRLPLVRKVQERSGTADGAVASLPDILPGLKEAFLEAEAAGLLQATVSPADAQGRANGAPATGRAAATVVAPADRVVGCAPIRGGGGGGGGGSIGAPSSKEAALPSAYGAWLAKSLARRRLFNANGIGLLPGPLQSRSFTTGPPRRHPPGVS